MLLSSPRNVKNYRWMSSNEPMEFRIFGEFMLNPLRIVRNLNGVIVWHLVCGMILTNDSYETYVKLWNSLMLVNDDQICLFLCFVNNIIRRPLNLFSNCFLALYARSLRADFNDCIHTRTNLLMYIVRSPPVFYDEICKCVENLAIDSSQMINFILVTKNI